MKLYVLITLLLASIVAAHKSMPVVGNNAKVDDTESNNYKLLMKLAGPESFLSPRPLPQPRAAILPHQSHDSRRSPHMGSVEGSAQMLYHMLQQRADPSVFDGVFASLREDITKQLKSTVGSVESNLQTRVDAIGACATKHGFDSGTALVQAYQAAEQDYNAAGSAFEEKVDEKNTKCKAKETSCNQRDNKGKALYTTVRGSTQCTLPQNPPVGTVYDDTFVLADVDGWITTIETQHTQWKESKGTCSVKTTTCADAEAAAAAAETAKTGQCSALDLAKANGKSAYDDCYNTAKGELDGYDWEAEVAAEKSSLEKLETLICYVKVAVKDIKSGGSVRKDGAGECKDIAGPGGAAQFECTCKSNDGEEHKHTYDVQVTVPDAPAEDTTWDTKGCAGNGGGNGGQNGGGAADGGGAVVEFNVGKAPITVPSSELVNLQGPLGFDKATVMWKIEWKVSFSNHYGCFFFWPGPPYAKICLEGTLRWNLRPQFGTTYFFGAQMHATLREPHVYTFEWSAATGQHCLSMPGLVDREGEEKVCKDGRPMFDANGPQSDGVIQGKRPDRNSNTLAGEWYYTKIYIQ